MSIIYKNEKYISESELAKISGVTKSAIRKRREQGKYQDGEVLVLKERVYYKVK